MGLPARNVQCLSAHLKPAHAGTGFLLGTSDQDNFFILFETVQLNKSQENAETGCAV